MITYGSTTLTSYNSIVNTEVYYYKSTSPTALSGGSWSTTKPTWESGKYVWQKIRTIYEDETYTESDPVNITGQQGATGTAAYSYKLNASDTAVTVSKTGEYSVNKITFTATYKQGTGAVTAYAGRFKIETTLNGTTWTTVYPTSGTGVNESSKEYTIPVNIMAIRCSLYQAGGISVLLDTITIPIVKDGIDGIGLEYIESTHTSSSSAWTGITQDDELIIGKTIAYKLLQTPTSTAVKLTLTLATGDKTSAIPVYMNNNTAVSNQYPINTIIQMTYDGSSWKIANYNTNTNTVGVYGGTVTAGENGIRGYSLIMKDTKDTWVSITTNAGASSKDAGTGTDHIKYSGGLYPDAIMYEGTQANYVEGAKTGTCYHALALNLRYSTNCGTTLVTNKDVYLVGTIHDNGLFYLDDIWWTQTIPTQEDGKVYIYLGLAYSTYQIYLATENNLYKFYDEQFRKYEQVQLLDGLNNLKENLESQIDGKVETWCQITNPATAWTTAKLKKQHNGDLWYYIGESNDNYKNNTTYKYTASTNEWAEYSASTDLFDIIDNKIDIYYGKPTITGAKEGDYLVDETDGSTYRYDATQNEWVKVTDYKTTITNAIDDIEIGGRNLLPFKDCSSETLTRGGITLTKEEDGWIRVSGTKSGTSLTTFTLWQNPDGDIYTAPINSYVPQNGNTNQFTLSVETEGTPFIMGDLYTNSTHVVAYGSTSGTSWRIGGINGTSITGVFPTYMSVIRYYIGVNSTGTVNGRFRVKLERGNKATDWTPAPEDVEDSIKTYVESIQSQVDGMAEIHYGTTVPTLDNTPASAWRDAGTEVLDMHLDDLYYNISTGYCYRFTKSGSTYSWTRIKDSDITAAATAASNANTAAGNAQTTANSANELAGQKRRIFVNTPTTPYEAGDLWVEGSSGDIKKCKTPRATGSYTASDWELASKYTDDTIANTANTKVDNLKKVRLGWKVNYSTFATANNGECYFHGYDSNNAATNDNGIVEWNGVDLTITKGMWINPNAVAPYNTPILHVFRTDTSPYHADVWWDDSLKKWRGYMYTTSQTPSTVSDWIWNETTDCILATYISPSSEGAIQSAQLFNPPKKFSELPDPSLAHELVDNIEIGGRNILLNSTINFPITYGSSTLTIEENVAVSEFGCTDGIRCYGTGGTSTICALINKASHDLSASSPVSIDGQPYVFSIYIKNNHTTNVFGVSSNVPGDTRQTVQPGEAKRLIMYAMGNGVSYIQFNMSTDTAGDDFDITFWHPQIELGNKVTDWTLAPEDVDANIQQVQDNLDNLKIGGRNLLKNSKALTTDWVLKQATVSDGIATITPDPNSSDTKRIYQIPTNGYWTWTVGQEYTVSIDARSDNGAPFNFVATGVGTNGNAQKSSDIVTTSTWARYSFTFTVVHSSEGSLTFQLAGSSNKTIQFKEPKLEYGGKATDWTPAPEDTQADIDTAIAQSVEYVIGTQTATTGTWTGRASTLSELKDGTQIRYWLPYAGSGNATLNLTLKDGTATGAIPVYRQGGSYDSTNKIVVANRVTTHFPAGTSISMIYGVNRIVSVVSSNVTYTGTFTGWFVDGAYNSDTYNRIRMQNAITAVTAITASRIICGTILGYKNIGAGIQFDLSYPLLYAASAITAGKTGDNNYLQINGINASNNGTIQSGATKKELYLKGTVTGNTFTIASSPFMTTVIPTSADGFYYMPLGIMYSATAIYFTSSNRLYAYLDGAFQPVDIAAILRAEEAKKSATNYMSSDNTGIMVADLKNGEQLPASITQGKNVYVTAGYGSGDAAVDPGVYIRDGQTDLAMFGENVRIGQKNDNYVYIDNDSVDIRNGDDVLASFGKTSIIGDQSQWHQTIASDRTSFANGETEYAYISPDKFYAVNAEVSDAFYIGNYSIRNAKDGKLIIGLRR